MTPDHLLDHFDRISDAPDAIPTLRRFILDLAVRGNLVEQNFNDEPASELMKRIQAWRSAAISEGNIRMPRKQILVVDASEAPYELPKLWDWVRLGQIIYIHSGDGLTSEAMRRGSVPVFGGNGITGFHDTPNVLRPTVVIGRVGYYCGSIHVTPSQAWITDNAFITEFSTDAIFQNFLVLLLKATTLKENEKATAQPVISGAKIYPIIVGLPPLAEQHRIVAKVDELMALCDRLEAAQGERENRRNKLAAASLRRLNNGAGADQYREHARFHLRHLQRLTTRPEHIQQLRQTILNLAVRGKLVPHDPNDEPVNEVLAKIQAERAQLLALNTIRQSRPVVTVIASEEMFDIPEQWIWVRLADLCHVITDGEHLTPQYSELGVPMLSAMHIGSHSLIFKDFKFVSEKTAEKCWSRCFPEERDILVVSRGAGVGRTIISKCRGYCLMGSVLLFKPASQVNERFLSNFLNSPIGNEKLRTTSGASAQQAIYIAHLKRDYVVPLPPLAEQARIVAKVEELMRLCDRMETQLTTTQTESRRLLEAVLHEAITLHTGER